MTPDHIAASNLCASLGCDHDCKSSLEGGTCVCPKGMKVANDSRSCVGEFHFSVDFAR